MKVRIYTTSDTWVIEESGTWEEIEERNLCAWFTQGSYHLNMGKKPSDEGAPQAIRREKCYRLESVES